MDDRLHQLLADAKNISLTCEERQAGRDALAGYMAAGSAAPFSEAASGVSLNEEERQEGLQSLISFMKMHPVKQPAQRASFFSVFHNFFTMRLSAMAMIVVLLVATSGTAAYAAEDAVPGDLLYEFKINVTEPIRERWYARDPARHAEWMERRIGRRLQEAQFLAGRDELTPEFRELLQERIEKHSERLEQRIEALGSDDQADVIRERMEGRLDQHEQLLSGLKSGEAGPAEVQEFLKHVRKHKKHVRGRRKEWRQKHRAFMQQLPPEEREQFREEHRQRREEFREKLIENPELREEIRERREQIRGPGPLRRPGGFRGEILHDPESDGDVPDVQPQEREEFRPERFERPEHPGDRQRDQNVQRSQRDFGGGRGGPGPREGRSGGGGPHLRQGFDGQARGGGPRR